MEKRRNLWMNAVIVGLLVIMVLSLVMAFALNADAATVNPGEKAATWFMDQVFWIALAVIAGISVTFVIKRSWTALIIFGVMGAIVLVIISNPERLQKFGEAIFGILGL